MVWEIVFFITRKVLFFAVLPDRESTAKRAADEEHGKSRRKRLRIEDLRKKRAK